MKRTSLLMALTTFFFILSTSVSFADRTCSTLLAGECVGCHAKDNFCRNAGKSEKYWGGMLGLMESNGADLTKNEFKNLKECLSAPTEEVTNICK